MPAPIASRASRNVASRAGPASPIAARSSSSRLVSTVIASSVVLVPFTAAARARGRCAPPLRARSGTAREARGRARRSPDGLRDVVELQVEKAGAASACTARTASGCLGVELEPT